MAARAGEPALLDALIDESLLERHPIHALDDEGRDLLELTLSLGGHEAGPLMKRLVELGADPVRLIQYKDRNWNRRNYGVDESKIPKKPLACAVALENWEGHGKDLWFALTPEQKLLCAEHGALAQFARAGNQEGLDDLLKAGANPEQADEEGELPLSLAQNMNQVEALMKAGARFDSKDKNGKAPIQLLLERSGKEMALEVARRQMKESKGAGVDGASRAQQEEELFRAACKALEAGRGPQAKSAIQGLGAAKAAKMIRKEDNATLLTIACGKRNLSVASILAKAGADMAHVDAKGISALALMGKANFNQYNNRWGNDYWRGDPKGARRLAATQKAVDQLRSHGPIVWGKGHERGMPLALSCFIAGFDWRVAGEIDFLGRENEKSEWVEGAWEKAKKADGFDEFTLNAKGTPALFCALALAIARKGGPGNMGSSSEAPGDSQWGQPVRKEKTLASWRKEILEGKAKKWTPQACSIALEILLTPDCLRAFSPVDNFDHKQQRSDPQVSAQAYARMGPIHKEICEFLAGKAGSLASAPVGGLQKDAQRKKLHAALEEALLKSAIESGKGGAQKSQRI